MNTEYAEIVDKENGGESGETKECALKWLKVESKIG